MEYPRQSGWRRLRAGSRVVPVAVHRCRYWSRSTCFRTLPVGSRRSSSRVHLDEAARLVGLETFELSALWNGWRRWDGEGSGSLPASFEPAGVARVGRAKRSARSRRRRTVPKGQMELLQRGRVSYVFSYSFMLTDMLGDAAEIER
jgi:hypothetical protein